MEPILVPFSKRHVANPYTNTSKTRRGNVCFRNTNYHTSPDPCRRDINTTNQRQAHHIKRSYNLHQQHNGYNRTDSRNWSWSPLPSFESCRNECRYVSSQTFITPQLFFCYVLVSAPCLIFDLNSAIMSVITS